MKHPRFHLPACALLSLLIVSMAGCGQETHRDELEGRHRGLEEQGKRMAELRKTIDEQRRENHAASYSYEGTIDDRTELNRWLAKTLMYPAAARDNGVQGKVRLRFRVNKDGTTTDLHVHRSSGYRVLDEEALSVASHLPPFGGALLENAGADSLFILPIRFKLQ